MTKILQLLLVAVAIGLGVDAKWETPPYKQYVQAMEHSAATLKKNVLSMEGNIPLLNDSRRHYAEIVHVVYYMGQAESGGARYPYYEYYPQCLNTSAPDAINHPEEVVDEIREIQDDVRNNIYELKELINACVQTNEVCNKLIDDTVKENPEQFEHPARVLIAAGDVATDLNELNGKFEEVSKNLNADQYVITSPEELEQIVWAVAHLHQVFRPPF